MATPQERLADSLKELQKLQNKNVFAVVRSGDVSRTHLTRLVQNGYLQEVMKGWYISSRPDGRAGDSTNWYTSFWFFVTAYAGSRFGTEWCLSANQSLSIYSGNRSVLPQVIIRLAKGHSDVVGLPHNTSILCFQAAVANPIVTEPTFGLHLYSLPEALVECGPDFFRRDSIAARTCLSMISDASDILKIVLDRGQTTKAGRLAGAFRNIGNTTIADEIVSTMKGLGYDIREEDPFEDKIVVQSVRAVSPYVTRLKLMWGKMREVVIDNFPRSGNTFTDIEECMRHIEAKYEQDAYNSLSIEGYRVTDELIEKVRSGNWQPDRNSSDAEQRNAMAARGYWQTFQAVKQSVGRILGGAHPGEVVEADHRTWYRELFAPSVTAGLIRASDLAGYRNQQVYIRDSLHTPLSPEAVRDACPVFFELLRGEPDAGVRAVLGHFMFVYIHPYMDGNGRMARFLMNAMLISGGYEWTVVPLEKRKEYMSALEKASVEEDIADFARLLSELI